MFKRLRGKLESQATIVPADYAPVGLQGFGILGVAAPEHCAGGRLEGREFCSGVGGQVTVMRLGGGLVVDGVVVVVCETEEGRELE